MIARFLGRSNRRGNNVDSYTVAEASTPIEPSDMTGGSGQVTLAMGLIEDGKMLSNVPVELTDGSNGITEAIVRSIGISDRTLSVTADSRISRLNSVRKAQPFVGSVEDAFLYYLSLVGIEESVVVDSAIQDIPVDLPGWEASVYEQIKKICVVKRVEMSLVSNNIVLRPLRGRTVESYRNSQVNVSVDTSGSAQKIRVWYYNGQHRDLALAYPPGGWDSDAPVWSVPEGEVIVYDDIAMDASLTSIQQPRCIDTVYNEDIYEESVYSVTGNDGAPITAKQWIDNGGSLKVEINPDTVSLKVTITGARIPLLGPFSIAAASGTSNLYSSVRLLGTGHFIDRKSVDIPTSIDPDRAASELVEIDNTFMGTLEEAYTTGIWSLARYTGPVQSLNVSTAGVNRRGVTGSYRYATIAEFNTRYENMSIADFNAVWAGRTIAEFNQAEYDLAQGDFANQAFGNVAGARALYDDTYFRIRTASITQDGVTYTGEGDTTIKDFNRQWAGFSILDFNKQWSGKRLVDFAVAPLKRSPELRPTVREGYGSGEYGRNPYGD